MKNPSDSWGDESSSSRETLSSKRAPEFACVVPVKVTGKVNVTGDTDSVRTNDVEVHACVAANECMLCHVNDTNNTEVNSQR